MEKRQYSFQTGQRNTFGVLDYILFSFLLIISAGIGLFYAIKDRKRKNTKEFLLAGGNMSAIPVSLSLLASFMSAITLLGTPSEMYNYTTMYWYIGLGYFFTIAIASHMHMPIFYRLRVTSSFKYLELRFGSITRTFASVIYVIQMVLYMSIVLYAPSLALNAVTGFTLWGSIWAVGLVCIFYTTLGGMKAVLWTDTFQVGMMIIGLLTILIQGSIEVGGFSKAWEIAADSGRINFSDFSVDPAVRHSFWTCVFGGAFTWLAVYGGNQAQIQRAITCPTLRKAQIFYTLGRGIDLPKEKYNSKPAQKTVVRLEEPCSKPIIGDPPVPEPTRRPPPHQIAYWINFPGLCVILYLCCLIGIVIYAFYRTCDPKTFGLITASDQLLPLFVMDVLGHIPGIPGIFVSCLFSGALSTLSSGLNSIAAVILMDVLKIFCIKDLNEERSTNASKLLALVFGFICLGLTYVASLLGGVLQAALALFGVIGGPILGIFTLGMIFPWANQKGAVAGMATSLIFMLWIGVGYQVWKPKVATFSQTSLSGCNWNLTMSAPPGINMTDALLNAPTTISSTITQSTASIAETSSNPLLRLYSLSYLWYCATAVLVAVGVGLIVSFITGRTKANTVDPRLMCPIFDVFMPFLPEKIRKPLRLGVDYSKIKDPADTTLNISSPEKEKCLASDEEETIGLDSKTS